MAQKSVFNYKLIDDGLPSGETIMETFGISTGFDMKSYDPSTELASFECIYCGKELRNEDPSLEKHIIGYCIYHPDSHLNTSSDPRSSGFPTRMIPRKLGISVTLPAECSQQNLQGTPEDSNNDTVIQLYDRIGLLTLFETKVTIVQPQEQLKLPVPIPSEPVPNKDDSEEEFQQLTTPDQETRFNDNPDDPNIQSVLKDWNNMSPDDPRRCQFYMFCFICKQSRGSHVLMPCAHAPVCCKCYQKYVKDEMYVCPENECNKYVEYAILQTSSFEPSHWVTEII